MSNFLCLLLAMNESCGTYNPWQAVFTIYIERVGLNFGIMSPTGFVLVPLYILIIFTYHNLQKIKRSRTELQGFSKRDHYIWTGFWVLLLSSIIFLFLSIQFACLLDIVEKFSHIELKGISNLIIVVELSKIAHWYTYCQLKTKERQPPVFALHRLNKIKSRGVICCIFLLPLGMVLTYKY
jgi:hypothetical protein